MKIIMRKVNIPREIDAQLGIAKQRIKGVLTPVKDLSIGQMEDILARYKLAIEPNFVPWMQRALDTARSEITRNALSENIQAEVSQDHPKMLRDFVESSGVIITPEHYSQISRPVQNIWRLSGNSCSVTNVAIAATLESTSPKFIPYVENLGKKLGCRDFTYTNAHGEADIKHAEELQRGLVEEVTLARGYEDRPWNTSASAVNITTEFLESLFRVPAA